MDQPCCSYCKPLDGAVAEQKKIWQQVRISASLYLMNKSAFASGGHQLKYKTLPWNQSSDQQVAAIQPFANLSHGNSQRQTLTSIKPGACSPGGVGVDIKHNAYARYLNKKKAANLKAQTTAFASYPLRGNKTFSVNCVKDSSTCCR